MNEGNEGKILNSWRKNVKPWTCAIENGEIASREQVTNQALLDAIFAEPVNNLIDIGCGEGWLVRAMATRSVHALGVDGVQEFIDNQINGKYQQFLHVDYSSLSHQLLATQFDVAVCNFSLLGDRSVSELLHEIPALLTKTTGRLIIQTLHPQFTEGKHPYQSGWRSGSWQGFSESFVEPAPWYFRTVQDWLALFESSGFKSTDIIEPRLTTSGDPVSIIFKLKV